MAEHDTDHLVSQIPRSNEGKAERVIRLTRLGHSKYQPWATRVLKARRYYLGQQWDDISGVLRRGRMRLTDNVIRDDIDKRVARFVEAEPVMETHGRGAEDFYLGTTWQDLVRYADEWSGEMHDSAHDVRVAIYTYAHVDGDVFEWVTWDRSEEQGLGMVVSEMVPALNVVWSESAKSVQLRDARWVCRFEPVEIEDLEQEFPGWRGRFKSDVPGLFTAGPEAARREHYETSTSAAIVDLHGTKAYHLEFLEKRPQKRNRFLLDGKPALSRDDAGNVIEMDEAKFERLPKAQQEVYEQVAVDDYELWRTIVVNNYKVKEAISEDDTSKGGHGHYPFSRYCCTPHPDQTHRRGEVEPLMGFQDVINQTMSYGLERLFIDSSAILAIQRGGAPKSEEDKLDRIGEVAVQRYKYYPGAQLPQAVTLGNPQGAAMFQSMHGWLTERKDRQGQITDVHRAAPKYEMSGRAIQSLLAEADLSQSKMRHAIESGLRQATLLRIALMQQHMRANRMIRITPRAEQPGYQLYLTRSETEAVSANQLQKPEDAGADYYMTQDGDQARVLELSDASIRKFDLRLKLDTGKERNRAERMDLVTQVLNYAGPGAGIETLLWAVELMEVPNLERLVKALREEDAKTQLMQQVDQIQKETGMSLPEIAQIARQYAAVRGNGKSAALMPAGVGT